MSNAEPIRLLCTADLHLGRYPSRVPIGNRELSVEHVWDGIVDYAIDAPVDALVLAGDLVDEDNKFFESFGPLERGLRHLQEAGIRAYAVAGNHDYDVLPRLNDVLSPEFFHLLGQGGRWEEAVLTRDDRPVLGFLGWSFPTRRHRMTPLDDVPSPRTDIPVIGIVHGDLYAEPSPYAPLAVTDLKQVPVASWVLGHVHTASRADHRSGCILYPGSPQALDPGETGNHGPYILDVHPDGRVDVEQIPLGTVKYAACDVDLSDVQSPEEFESGVVKAVRDALQEEVDANEHLRHVVYRPRYVGRTSVEADIEKLHEQVRAKLEVPAGAAYATVDGFRAETRSAVDLSELSSGSGPLSELARLLLCLETGEGGEDVRPLVRSVMSSIGSITRASAYSPLREHDYAEDPDEAEAKKMLRRQGMLLLDELVSQTRSGVS